MPWSKSFLQVLVIQQRLTSLFISVCAMLSIKKKPHALAAVMQQRTVALTQRHDITVSETSALVNTSCCCCQPELHAGLGKPGMRLYWVLTFILQSLVHMFVMLDKCCHCLHRDRRSCYLRSFSASYDQDHNKWAQLYHNIYIVNKISIFCLNKYLQLPYLWLLPCLYLFT